MNQIEQLTPEEMALEVKRLAGQLQAEGRSDLLLKALGVPLLEELRIKKVFLDMMDEYTASYYIISSHTQRHVAGSSRIWYQRLKVITLPRELVIYRG
ncbi:MAG: hypothetical protein J5931_04845 [Prevotella sp.]|nr:hypothetical protein [Prevotella sp.]